MNTVAGLSVDHIFVFTPNERAVTEKLTGAGFCKGPRRIHEGQGTSNICFFFKNFYLELIWISDEKEAKEQSKIRLFDRSNWRRNHSCPFGICFTGPRKLTPFDKADVWTYSPSYIPSNTHIDIVKNPGHFLSEPMFFFLPFKREVPEFYKRHNNGANNITNIKIAMKIEKKLSSFAKSVDEHGLVSFKDGVNYELELTFDEHKQNRSIELFEEIPLRICI